MDLHVISKTRVVPNNNSNVSVFGDKELEGGCYHRIAHMSASTQSKMIFGLFLPSSFNHAHATSPIPVLFWLSGLTCDDTNFAIKAGPKAFAAADKRSLAIAMPDTSPRHEEFIPNVDTYDLGIGAGFYVDATCEPYHNNYHMYTYVSSELPQLLDTAFFKHLGQGGLRSISGHSMGGHGALIIALREGPSHWCSVSAFAPICNPTACPWGIQAFSTYLGDVEKGAAFDATCILSLRDTPISEYGVILIDQGTSDQFLREQLKPESLVEAAKKCGQGIQLNMRHGFDHSYHFIAAFIDSHVDFHADRLSVKVQSRKGSTMSQSGALQDFTLTAGKPILCKAMVARGPKIPLSSEMITVDPPKAGEVRVKVIANALCHTDIYTLDGCDPEGKFPCILGHEAGCIVESVGEGVCSVKPGDHVIPCYTPQCCMPQCIFCQSPKTNLCPQIRSTQGQGVMPDGTVRFTDSKGNSIWHFMGCSTMSEYTVLAEISCAKINKAASLDKVCLFGCGISTGLGAVWNTCKVEANSTVAVFGLGAVGLAVIQGAQLSGASRIIAVDVNPGKFPSAIQLGATDTVNPTTLDRPVQQYISGVLTQWGVDYSFDCTGNTQVMRSALECAHRGWGVSCIIGVAASGHEISTRPFQLVTGRVWKGTAFGGFKSRRDVPWLVEKYLNGDLPIEHYITHEYDGVEQTNLAINALHSGDCLRAVVRY